MNKNLCLRKLPLFLSPWLPSSGDSWVERHLQKKIIIIIQFAKKTLAPNKIQLSFLETLIYLDLSSLWPMIFINKCESIIQKWCNTIQYQDIFHGVEIRRVITSYIISVSKKDRFVMTGKGVRENPARVCITSNGRLGWWVGAFQTDKSRRLCWRPQEAISGEHSKTSSERAFWDFISLLL